MAIREIVNIGTLPNDGEGDPLRVAFAKINNNFANLFSTSFNTSNTFTVGNSAQPILEIPVSDFTQGLFQIRSSNPDNQDSQDIMISAQITNNGTDVKFSGYGTTFVGNCITRYDMDVTNGNVRMLVEPLVDQVLFHFVSSQITSVGSQVPGLLFQLDGYVDDTVLSAENDLLLTTENP